MKMVLASNNKGKIQEFAQLLKPLHIEIVDTDDLALDAQEETGQTFVENALQKARFAARLSHLPALADDSGLVVPALNGAPGIYSARFAGPKKDDQANIKKLLNDMKDLTDDKRKAYFYCALVYLSHADDPTPIICTGIWQGKIIQEQKGQFGFGYDPIFYLPELFKTAAELSPEIKNKISHRGLACQALLSYFRETHESTLC